MKTALRQILLTPTLSPEARAYIKAVEQADGSPLESVVKAAINNFVVSCKNDGIWDAIQDCCILAGARSLSGALVPLKGTAPTNLNFVSGDYLRATGLKGNGTNKELNTNKNHASYPQDNFHYSCWVSNQATGTAVYIGAGTATNEVGASNCGFVGSYFVRNQSSANTGAPSTISTNFLLGSSRNSSATISMIAEGTVTSVSIASQTPLAANMFVFSSGAFRADARLAFYSMGSAINLALLNSRVSALINSFTGLT